MGGAPTGATAFWASVETIHDVVYFAPEAKARFEDVGLKGFWMGYFASRSAAFGAPGPELVTATFHGFSPVMVQRALPDAWALASPQAVLRARLDLARDALAPAVEVYGPLDPLAASLQAAMADLTFAGKPLAAVHAAVPAPDPVTDPIGALWHAATVFREYRGDCHVAVLTAAGLGGCAANALQVATGRALPGQRESRGWTVEEWSAAQHSLQEWGWLDEYGEATETGRAARARIEDATDRACTAGMNVVVNARIVTMTEQLLDVARLVADSGAVPFPNPTGGRRP